MKHLLLMFTALSCLCLFSCDKEDDNDNDLDCTIEGRWIVQADQINTLWQFENGLQYTIYTSDTTGTFGPIEDAIPNPHDYFYEGDTLVIDLNFGNFSRTLPVYKCDCNVVELTSATGTQALYKEDYTYEDCDE